jgi:signal transduction histidine kinase
VASRVARGQWCLSVADNGVGIYPGQLGRLFQVFQRLQSRANFEGSGVGLALCRKIAEHHGGRIWAESAGDGQGSRFCVSLPLAGDGG